MWADSLLLVNKWGRVRSYNLGNSITITREQAIDNGPGDCLIRTLYIEFYSEYKTFNKRSIHVDLLCYFEAKGTPAAAFVT